MAKKVTHVHRLKRHKYPSGNSVYFCTLPDCHYKLDVPLSLGKRTICNICGDEFIMNEYSIKLAKPHCNNCGKVMIKDAGGKKTYAKKISAQVLSNNDGSSQTLRERLDSTIKMDTEEDI